MAQEKPKRVFLAMDLPEELKEQLVAIQTRLKHHLEGVRWVRPEGIHVTLKFFGNIFDKDIDRIAEVVAPLAKDTRVVALTGEGVGAFPRLERPRVLWLRVKGDVERLVGLQGAIETKLEEYGYKKETRRFSPHLTLGRAKSSRGMIIGVSEAVARGDTYSAGSFVSEGLTLFKSDLTPGGAVYTALKYFPFAGG
jgi:2'-5' RNA ligase